MLGEETEILLSLTGDKILAVISLPVIFIMILPN
jgi:hypothetical protein